MMEPKLVIFYHENSQQMFVCAENKIALEIPTCGWVYSFCKATLFFMQDILMGKPDKIKRPTRDSYSTCILNNLSD